MTNRTDRLAARGPRESSSQSRNVRQSTPPPPPPPADPEVPRLFYQTREDIHEYDWQEQELRQASLTAFGWRVIDQNRLNPLLVPAGRAYNRLTSLFYQNMSFDGDTERLSSRIDGWDFSFTKEDLARALGIPTSAADTELPVCPPGELPETDEECYPLLNELYPVELQGEVTRRTAMRQDMWFIDNFITKQVYPIGHKSERRPPLPKYLLCVQRGFFFDAAQLIFNTMWRVHRHEFAVRGKKKSACAMPYMRYIHSLLTHLGYRVRPDERHYAVIPKFTLTLWRQSLRGCRGVLNIPETDDEEEVKHMKWTKFYTALPQFTPEGFVPWVPRAQRPPARGDQAQSSQQGGAAAQEEVIADWDGVLLPPRSRQTRKRRVVTGEGTSAAAADQEEPASRGDIEQILAGMQNLQLGFQTFSGQFGEVPLYQRVDDMYGRVQNVEQQVQDLRADFTHFRQQTDERYQQYQTYHDQQLDWQQQFQQQQQTWQEQFQQQQEAHFEQLHGDFFESRHYQREEMRRHLDATQMEELQRQAEEMRNLQYHQPPHFSHPDDI